ncbi:MAG: energy transducer TonB, partial [Psychroserpens sp.]|nr:energy transducer TonB [Psychroserpens sp.]
PHPDLEEEAIRVISELPTFIPGKDDGKTVSVVYALPIKFQVVGKKRKRNKKN